MQIVVSTLLLLASCGLTAAEGQLSRFTSNLAYRSPSLNHQALEVNLVDVDAKHAKLRKRNNGGDNYWQGNVSFPYGIASGDPFDDSVILQTVPQKLDLAGLYGGNAYPPICIDWMVSESEDFSSPVSSGQVYTSQEVGWSAKVEASGLQPYTKYNYVFQSCAGADLGRSLIGSFKTLPPPDAMPDSIRLAVFSCANLPYGFFNAYGAAANHSETLDYAVHVGDYIYEYADGAYGSAETLGRYSQPLNRECSSLQDYRDRYGSYRMDPDLAALHQKVAWQATWDDHEMADNAYGDGYNGGSADSNNTRAGQVGDVQWSQRKANAVRAYYEWMPIRQVDLDDKLRIWRNFKVGKLLDLTMVDTRSYDRSITDLYYNTETIALHRNDENRTMTGEKQQAWLFDRLDESKDRGAHWHLLAQQVVFGDSNYTIVSNGGNTVGNVDGWSGYAAQRDRILKYLQDKNIDNTVILAGDSHATWVYDTIPLNSSTYDPVSGNGSLAVEFAGSAVSSPSSYSYDNTDEFFAQYAAGLVEATPALQYAEGQLRGYFEVTVRPEEVQADYYGFYDQDTRNSNVTNMATFFVDRGTNKLRRPINGGNPVAYGKLGRGSPVA